MLKANDSILIYNTLYLEQKYQSYLNGEAVEEDWHELFKNLENPASEESISIIPSDSAAADENLKECFRSYGHVEADLDPLGLTRRSCKNLPLNHPNQTLLKRMKKFYCGTLTAELTHITNKEEREWLISNLEDESKRATSDSEKIEILKSILGTKLFEEFLHKKFVGAKRFSNEGGDSLIPLLKKIIESAVAQEIVIAMAHRGRLSTLAEVMQKPHHKIFREFSSIDPYPNYTELVGDVKYHLGYSCDLTKKNGDKVHLSMCSNPSHLEAVNPVLLGKVRAKQDLLGKQEKVLGILIHGDAAFAGQGVVYESLAISAVEGYSVGGIIHIIINNQIGFTTSKEEGRGSPEPSDLAKYLEIPIIHVNGDDPEAVVFAAKLSSLYRDTFAKDIVINLVCFRRYGHNEGDEPRMTNPLMYNAIDNHPDLAHIYWKRVEGKLDFDLSATIDSINSKLSDEFKLASEAKTSENEPNWYNNSAWNKFRYTNTIENYPDTGIQTEEARQLGEIMSSFPEGFSPHPKVAKHLINVHEVISSGEGINWAIGEALALGSLLQKGYKVRFSGEDVGRGTFSHRHIKLTDHKTGETYIPLSAVSNNIEVINSPLSEYGVMGFEYGYSITDPMTLVIWEAQFGDFNNGAQIIIDQFIASGETKWQMASGVVLLLPHGYEGQGPEHSSARIERFLQLCADHNMQVVNCTTPANYFHVLKRQMIVDYRKPLIIFTPKSLLRHKRAVSNLGDFLGTFQPVITRSFADNEPIKIILCSGKIYYDLEEALEGKSEKVILISVEQLYPLPIEEILQQISQYPQVKTVIWCQEEPRNMGAWQFINENLFVNQSFKEVFADKIIRCVARAPCSSPSTGYSTNHAKEQKELIEKAIN